MDYKINYKMPLTLEQHFINLKNCYPQVEDIYNLWGLLKKRITEELGNTLCVFQNYSFHDASHSRTIIHAIESFLGNDRISSLSPTDTFMILASAYAHDYGMAQNINRIYEILGNDDFKSFIYELQKKQNILEPEDALALENIINYINNNTSNISLQDIYLSIVTMIQAYLRPKHWKGVIDIKENLKGLFQGHLKERFISGIEGLISICMCHGQDISSICKLSCRAEGMVGDKYHPRFVAAMLRLGDLLDLDNGRFPMWFVREIQKKNNNIPKLSILNYKKHEAITHFLITPEKIEIAAHCSSDPNKIDGVDVAKIISDWTDWLSAECEYLLLNWSNIAPPDFGRPPQNPNVEIFVDNMPYKSEIKELSMKMSQDKVMVLLEGTNIYSSKYVGIREILQNAIDASLLQLCKDILENRYTSLGLYKDDIMPNTDIMEFLKKNCTSIFSNYNIKVEVIKDKLNNKVYVVIKDKGIGILPEDLKYISEVGASKENNKHIKAVMDKMPPWLKPSGVFGIGLQSVFQLTDRIDFYTRQPNMPELKISLFSHGKNQGRIEVREVPKNTNGLYYDNAVPGTNVKIEINKNKLLGNADGDPKKHLQFYDLEFDTGNDLDVLFAEVSLACKNIIEENSKDYFNVYFEELECNGENDKFPKKFNKKNLKTSYFSDFVKGNRKNNDRLNKIFGYNVHTLFQQKNERDSLQPYAFNDNTAYYWDEDSCRFYTLKLRPCIIKEKTVNNTDVKQVYLPDRIPNLYEISYKFNKISNVKTIYSQYNRKERYHAGFLNMDILILDGNPQKYVNIDRERLKEGAINENNILDTRKKILEEWCRYFLKENASQKTKQNLSNRFNDKPEMLLSLILLFYQNVPDDIFNKFKDIYYNELAAMNLTLGDEKVKFIELLDKNNEFVTIVDNKYGLNSDNTESSVPADMGIKMNAATVRHLPHRLINIKSIEEASNDMLLYKFSIQKTMDNEKYIKMDTCACMYDYFGVFEKQNDGKELKINCDKIQKKVFKPNESFKNLIVLKYPHTFDKGKNLMSAMDYCICGYILSPFDKEAARKLKNDINNNKNNVSEFIKYVMEESNQLKKCVQYVLKFGVNRAAATEDDILNQYEDFIKDFYNLVINNIDKLMEYISKED